MNEKEIEYDDEKTWYHNQSRPLEYVGLAYEAHEDH